MLITALSRSPEPLAHPYESAASALVGGLALSGLSSTAQERDQLLPKLYVWATRDPLAEAVEGAT